MFNADEEDASLRTPPVRPNDILDIEVSPVGHLSTAPGHAADSESRKTSDTASQKVRSTKEKREKGAKTVCGHSKLRRRSESPMKRGDPFLPSVISDENPFVDYPVRKASKKKPSDCKCKGNGYNLSPSALLPEEMRQQWGVGVFGKPTPPKIKPAASPCHPGASIAQLVGVREGSSGLKVVSTTFSEQPRSSMDADMCPMCLTDQCSCPTRPQEGFRIPDKSDKRYSKHRTGHGKNKENRAHSGTKGNSAMIKRIACYSYKENKNIISTSNFSKHNASGKVAPETSYAPTSFENSYFKTNLVNSRLSSHPATLSSMDYHKTFTGRSDISITPKTNNKIPTKPRRILANLTPSPALSNSASQLSNIANAYETSKSLSRAAKQMMLMGGNQMCSCPGCRRPNTFLSRMEALGFSSGHTQHSMYSPIVFPTSQRYGSTSNQTPLSSRGRYAPYTTQSFGYTKSSEAFYTSSSDVYRCSSLSYDYDTPYYRGRALTPLSMAHEMSKLDNSFSILDNEMPELSNLDESKDITDLSIKDTVDFFVGMKSPFVTSSPSALSDTSSGGIYNAMSPEEESFSPCYHGGSGPCLCPAGTCPGSFSSTEQYREFSCGDPVYTDQSSQRTTRSSSMITRGAPHQPMPLVYSSLVSDLEVELRSAIENIPTD